MEKQGNIERRSFLTVGLFFLGGLILSPFSEMGDGIYAAEPLNYDQLAATLYPKTEGEKKYLKEIASLVQKKKIPLKVVDAAWRYAKEKQKSKRMHYFSETLTLLCKRSGIRPAMKF